MKLKIKIPKKEKVFKKEKDALNSNVFWNIALYFAVVIIFVGFLFGYLSYKKINKEPFFSDVQTEDIKAAKEVELQQALDLFEKRSNKSNEILNATPVFIDPSL